MPLTETASRTSDAERKRIVNALIEVASERGYLDTTVDAVVERSGLDREAFERHFRDKHDCFVATWQEMSEGCLTDLVAAYNSEEDWPDRLRALAYQAVDSLRSDPRRALFSVEVLAAGEGPRARRDMTMRVISSLIDAGRREMEDPESVPHTTAEALAGSAYGQIFAKVVQGDIDELPELVPQLVAAAVMPYLGVEAGLEELARASGEDQGYVVEVNTEPADISPGGADELPPELARLPPGRHGLPREFVARNQHERLIAGLAEAVSEHGYAGTTISHITRHAAVSRRTFYEHFEGKDECFAAAYEMVIAELRERVALAFEEGADWPHSIKAGIAAMLRFLASEPELARLCLVEAMVAGPVVVERYDAAIQSFVPYFQAGREGRPREVLERLSPATEEALIGGMISLISRRVLAGRTNELEELLPDLVEFVLTPYLGAREATEIAKQSRADAAR